MLRIVRYLLMVCTDLRRNSGYLVRNQLIIHTTFRNIFKLVRSYSRMKIVRPCNNRIFLHKKHTIIHFSKCVFNEESFCYLCDYNFREMNCLPYCRILLEQSKTAILRHNGGSKSYLCLKNYFLTFFGKLSQMYESN